MKDRDLRLCMGDYVGPPTNTAKFGRNRTSGGAPTRGWNRQVVWLFFSFFLSFLVSRARAQPERGGRFACEMAQKTRIGARTCLLGVRVVTNWGTGFQNPENPQNWAWNRGFPCKRKCQLSQKRYKIRKKCQRKSNRKVGVAFRMVPFGLTSGSRLTPNERSKVTESMSAE